MKIKELLNKLSEVYRNRNNNKNIVQVHKLRMPHNLIIPAKPHDLCAYLYLCHFLLPPFCHHHKSSLIIT
jgi:hypothetical protein